MVALDRERDALARLIRMQNTQRVSHAKRLAAVDRVDHVAVFERVVQRRRRADHEHPFVGAKIVSEFRRQGGELELAPATSEIPTFAVKLAVHDVGDHLRTVTEQQLEARIGRAWHDLDRVSLAIAQPDQHRRDVGRQLVNVVGEFVRTADGLAVDTENDVPRLESGGRGRTARANRDDAHAAAGRRLAELHAEKRMRSVPSEQPHRLGI